MAISHPPVLARLVYCEMLHGSSSRSNVSWSAHDPICFAIHFALGGLPYTNKFRFYTSSFYLCNRHIISASISFLEHYDFRGIRMAKTKERVHSFGKKTFLACRLSSRSRSLKKEGLMVRNILLTISLFLRNSSDRCFNVFHMHKL
jgi:hypothetical protein